MAETTKIEWADHTFNPWIGCTKVSPGCDNCYAAALAAFRYRDAKWGPGNPRRRTSTWGDPIKWNAEAEATGERPFVFCASLSDVFDNEADPQWRHDLFELIERTPNLIWLLLTKRIGNVLKMIEAPLPRNVAIGATMVTQDEYDRDIGKLADVKSQLAPAFTFGSLEPLLGPIILDGNAPDWIIVGGESGKDARPMDLDWARSLREQCGEMDRVFNFKQVGGRSKNKGGHELDGQTYFARPIIDRPKAVKSTVPQISIPVENIIVEERGRKLDRKWVKKIAGSIGQLGLRHPVSVRMTKRTIEGKRVAAVPVLVAGAHRLAAAKLLGWTHIDCVEVADDEINAQMWEIAENLHRRGLNKEQRDEQIRRYAELLEKQRVQSGQNVSFESKRADGRGHRPKGIASEIAAATGLSKRTTTRALSGSAGTKQDDPPASSEFENGRRARLAKAWNAASKGDQIWFINWVKANRGKERQAPELQKAA